MGFWSVVKFAIKYCPWAFEVSKEFKRWKEERAKKPPFIPPGAAAAIVALAIALPACRHVQDVKDFCEERPEWCKPGKIPTVTPPTPRPTSAPTGMPTATPTVAPSASPTSYPSSSPSPSRTPTTQPTALPIPTCDAAPPEPDHYVNPVMPWCPRGFRSVTGPGGVNTCWAKTDCKDGETRADMRDIGWIAEFNFTQGYLEIKDGRVCDNCDNEHVTWPDAYGRTWLVSKGELRDRGWSGTCAPRVCASPTVTPPPMAPVPVEPGPTPKSCQPLVRTSLGNRPHAISLEPRPNRHGPEKTCHWWDMTPRFGSGHGRPCNDEHHEICTGDGTAWRPCEDPRGADWRTNGVSDVEPKGFQIKLCGDPGQEYTVTACPFEPYLDGLGADVAITGDACDSRAWTF